MQVGWARNLIKPQPQEIVEEGEGEKGTIERYILICLDVLGEIHMKYTLLLSNDLFTY